MPTLREQIKSEFKFANFWFNSKSEKDFVESKVRGFVPLPAVRTFVSLPIFVVFPYSVHSSSFYLHVLIRTAFHGDFSYLPSVHVLLFI